MKKWEKLDNAQALTIISSALKIAVEEENNANYSKEIVVNKISSAVSSAMNDLEYGYIALGIKGQSNYVFSNYRQSLVVLGANDFSKQNLINIVGKKYLDENYEKLNDKGAFVGYDLASFQDDCVNACISEGNYNIENIKGYGIFADPLSKNHLIINTEQIWGTCPTFDKKRIRAKTIFNNEKDLMIEENQPQISRGQVKRLSDLLMTFNFTRSKQDMRLLMGWILMAPFAGVSKWRTHGSLTGRRGTGKSTLQELIKNLLGAFAKIFEGSSSEPGLRQAMGNSSGALLLDESEADGAKLASILAMLRAASSGIQKALGTSDQKGNVFELRMAGFLSGVVPPALKGADNSRFLKIELDIRNEKNKNVDIFDVEWQEQVGKELIITMIKNFKLLNELITKVRVNLLNSGADSRYADTYGALIASSFLILELVDDAFLDPFADNEIRSYTNEQLDDYINEFDFENEKAQSDFSDEDELLKQIFITEVASDDLKKENILQFILGYHLEKAEKSHIKNLLGRFGIKTEKEDGEIYVFLDCEDNKLKTMLKNTRFASGDLKAVLKRVKYSEEVGKEISIGNIRRSRKSLIKIKLDKTIYSLKEEIVLYSKEDQEDNPFK